MGLGSLLVRLVLGAIFVRSGTRKLFGWFGGSGPDGTGEYFESLGLSPGRLYALSAGASEAAGGASVATGLATPLGAAAIASVMVTALRTEIWRDGVQLDKGHHETLLLASAVALAENGPGRLSIDALLGRERSGTRWALAALGVSAAGSSLVIELGKRRSASQGPDNGSR